MEPEEAQRPRREEGRAGAAAEPEAARRRRRVMPAAAARPTLLVSARRALRDAAARERRLRVRRRLGRADLVRCLAELAQPHLVDRAPEEERHNAQGCEADAEQVRDDEVLVDGREDRGDGEEDGE